MVIWRRPAGLAPLLSVPGPCGPTLRRGPAPQHVAVHLEAERQDLVVAVVALPEQLEQSVEVTMPARRPSACSTGTASSR